MRMIRPTDIGTLDEFKRKSKQQIRRLRASGRPAVLTVNGKPAVVVQDVAAYERQMRMLEEMDVVSAVREGAADADAGRVVDARAYFGKFARPPASPARRSA